MKLITIFLAALFSLNGFAFPLADLMARVQTVRSSQGTPVAVFDLDETLLHSDARKTASYLKALNQTQSLARSQWPREVAVARSALQKFGAQLIRTLPNQYDSTALFHKIGIDSPDFVKEIDSEMLPFYLSSEFLWLDEPYFGARRVLEALYQAEGVIYFVSSRYESSQKTETVQRLKTLHLYHDDAHSRVILRKDQEVSIDFKIRAFSEIQATGPQTSIVLTAENEPENFNAQVTVFPGAMHVFIMGAELRPSVTLSPDAETVFCTNFSNDR